MQLTRRQLNGDMTFGAGMGNMCSGSESVAQNVVTRLRTFRGEWFLDTGFGTPHMQDGFIKPTNLPLYESDLKGIISTTDGVKQLLSFSLVYNSVTRVAHVAASLNDIYGNIHDIQVML